jgi:cytochrome c5
VKNNPKRILAGSALAALALAATASERLEDGKAAYEAKCASCHDEGVDGAPKTHNPADWDKRSHLWDAVLFEHAEKGYLKMPAKGGDEMATPYDVEAAAEYMVTITHPDLPHD